MLLKQTKIRSAHEIFYAKMQTGHYVDKCSCGKLVSKKRVKGYCLYVNLPHRQSKTQVLNFCPH